MVGMRDRVNVFILLSYPASRSHFQVWELSLILRRSPPPIRGKACPAFLASRAPCRPAQSDVLTPNSESRQGDTCKLLTSDPLS